MKNTITQDPQLLIKKAKQGNNEAFNDIYNLYFVPIFRYIYFRVNSKTEAEDLTQEVFLKAYQNIKNFKYKNKSPLNYFLTIARNTVIDHWRKKKELKIDENDFFAEIPDKNQNLEKETEKKEIIEIVKQSIQKLTKEQQEVIILKFINEKTNQEIANLLNKSEEAVRQLQCRALKFLRKSFKDAKLF
jgi:RNA polymerase sigma-70 factor (ECF subfamily)